MSTQNSATVRNAMLDVKESTIGTGPIIRFYNGTPPTNCAAALSGNTLLAEGTLPSDWLAAAASGSKAKNGTWTMTGQTGAGTGTAATFYRIFDSSGSTCHEQGTITGAVTISTNGTTAVNANVLNFASTTGVTVGMNVTGTGVPVGSTVVAVTSTTVTISHTSTAGVANGASIGFGGDLTLDNNSIANGQSITFSAYTSTAGNA